MDKRYTRLPPTIKKIMKHHAQVEFKISKWLREELGCKLDWYYDATRTIRGRTSINIQINHANDYVECGPGYDDPTGKMFDITTNAKIRIKFSAQQIRKITIMLEKLSDHEIEIPKVGNIVYLNFFDWERKLEVNWFKISNAESITIGTDAPVFEMVLDFNIHHKITN